MLNILSNGHFCNVTTLSWPRPRSACWFPDSEFLPQLAFEVGKKSDRQEFSPLSVCSLWPSWLVIFIQGGEPERADSTSSCTWSQSAPGGPGGSSFLCQSTNRLTWTWLGCPLQVRWDKRWGVILPTSFPDGWIQDRKWNEPENMLLGRAPGFWNIMMAGQERFSPTESGSVGQPVRRIDHAMRMKLLLDAGLQLCGFNSHQPAALRLYSSSTLCHPLSECKKSRQRQSLPDESTAAFGKSTLACGIGPKKSLKIIKGKNFVLFFSTKWVYSTYITGENGLKVSHTEDLLCAYTGLFRISSFF